MDTVVNGLGRIVYNGIDLTSPYVTSECDATAVFDPTGRVLDYVEHRFVIRTVLLSEDTTVTTGSGDIDGNNMAAAVNFLSQPGKAFIYTGHGVTEFYVNVQNPLTGKTVYDVDLGPRTKVLKFKRLGGSSAFELTFELTTRLAACECQIGIGTCAGDTTIRYVTWGAKFSINARGQTTRVIAGEIAMANQRADNSVGQTADYYLLRYSCDKLRERFSPPLLDGFVRTSEWDVDPGKSILRFTITDAEERLDGPNPWPQHVTSIDIRHRVSYNSASPRAGIFVGASHVLSGHCEVVAPYDGRMAWMICYCIARDRLKRIRDQNKDLWVALLAFHLDEGLFTRRVDFSMTFIAIGKVAKPEDLGKSPKEGVILQGKPTYPTPFDRKFWIRNQLFSPISKDATEFIGLEELTWENYRKSMKNAWSNRGNRRLAVSASDEKMTNLCDEEQNLGPKSLPPYLTGISPFEEEDQEFDEGLTTKEVPEENSYLGYEMSMLVVSDSGISESVAMYPKKEQESSTGGEEGNEEAPPPDIPLDEKGADSSKAFAPSKPPKNKFGRAFVARNHAGKWRVVIRGSATRLGQPVQIPTTLTLSVEGKPGIKLKFVYATGKIQRSDTGKQVDGHPIHSARFFMTFVPVDKELDLENLKLLQFDLSQFFGYNG